nr:MAG TPA: hypothetical protein [Caudoviricetes sp.]
MISNEERREVSARLREVYTYEEEIEPFVTCDMCGAFGYVLGEKFCEESFDCREAEYVILNKLADFIYTE